jgi:hypothetical protein
MPDPHENLRQFYLTSANGNVELALRQVIADLLLVGSKVSTGYARLRQPERQSK